MYATKTHRIKPGIGNRLFPLGAELERAPHELVVLADGQPLVPRDPTFDVHMLAREQHAFGGRHDKR